MAVPSDHDIILALGEDLPVGLWVARAPNGELVYANKMFGEIMGMGARGDVTVGGYAEPYGIFTRDGAPYPEERLPFVRALQERAVVVVDDITIHRGDGTRVDVRAFARPVNEPITHVVIAFFDITREVAAERARVEADQRLSRAQRLEAVGTLAGGIAHDFNNLIFGIKLVAAELANSERDPKRRAALGLIDEITERSAKLTKSLQSFAGRGKQRTTAIALDEVVRSMADMLARTQTGVSMILELERGTIVADPTQIEQVIMNLVVNACDAMHGGGHIAMRTRTVDLVSVPPTAIPTLVPGRYVVLEVADDGPGIPIDIRDRVFEPYFTTKTQGPERGTGLGLATVLGIVERHGGACEIASGLDGRGTTLRVYLPASELQPVVHARAVQSEAAPRGTGTILVVDDDPIVRRAVAGALEGLGYETAEAESGAEAVRIYQTRGSELCAVVLDLVMPEMNGKQTYLALRAIDPDVDVILMSGKLLDDEVQEIVDLGVRTFVSKPYRIEDLARAVARFSSR